MRIPFENLNDQAPERSAVAVAGGAIWIDPRGKTLRRIDAVTGEILGSTPLDYAIELLTPDDGSLWAVGPYGYAPGPDAYTVASVDLDTGTLHQVASVPNGDVAVGLGSIWVGVYGRRLQQRHPATGEIAARWPIVAERVQVACGAVWAWEFEGGLTRLDPVSGRTTTLRGEGPLYATDEGCWRWVTDEGAERVAIERVWPEPSVTTKVESATRIQYDGSTLWLRPRGLMQRWDPMTALGVGPRWILDEADIDPYWKVGDDGIVLSAGGRLWLINGFELVGFDIPAD